MDSITQIALGAAVGEAILGRRAGRRAALWGAICGTLPDLDVAWSFGDAVADFTYHRSWSHSLLVLIALTPAVAWVIRKLHRDPAVPRRGWLALVFWVFVTHVLLDCFTVYGTQIFWPLGRAPESWSTIFVIDPLYTVPLLAGVAAALRWNRRRPRRAAWCNALGLASSTLYLLWTVAAKLHVEHRIETHLARNGIAHQRILTTPTPFNSLLWNVVVMDETGYYEGCYSLIADADDVVLEHHASAEHLLEPIRDHWPVQRLRWFTHGFYSVRQLGEDILVSDLRMGIEPTWFFRFVVARLVDGQVTPIEPTMLMSSRPPLERLGWIWRRIWNRDARW